MRFTPSQGRVFYCDKAAICTSQTCAWHMAVTPTQAPVTAAGPEIKDPTLTPQLMLDTSFGDFLLYQNLISFSFACSLLIEGM